MQSTTIWMWKPSWESSLSQERKYLQSVSHPFKVSLPGLEIIFIPPFFLSVPFPLHKKEPVQSNHCHHVLCRSLPLIANTPSGPSWWEQCRVCWALLPSLPSSFSTAYWSPFLFLLQFLYYYSRNGYVSGNLTGSLSFLTILLFSVKCILYSFFCSSS